MGLGERVRLQGPRIRGVAMFPDSNERLIFAHDPAGHMPFMGWLGRFLMLINSNRHTHSICEQLPSILRYTRDTHKIKGLRVFRESHVGFFSHERLRTKERKFFLQVLRMRPIVWGDFGQKTHPLQMTSCDRNPAFI